MTLCIFMTNLLKEDLIQKSLFQEVFDEAQNHLGELTSL
jgi:hypothetical protein